MSPRIQVIDALCSCEHGRRVHGGPDGACMECDGCLGWTRPADEQAALVDRELSEIVELDGRAATVGTELSADVLTSLVEVENDFDRKLGWDNHPGLYVIKGARTPLGEVQALTLEPVDVPHAMWNHPTVDVIETLAHEAHRPDVRQVLLNAAHPRAVQFMFIGVALVGEGWVRVPGGDLQRSALDHPELRLDEVRFVDAVDVDERQYSVMRMRKPNTVVSQVVTPRRWLQDLHEHDSPEARLVRETSADGWTALPRALRNLVRALSAGAR